MFPISTTIKTAVAALALSVTAATVSHAQCIGPDNLNGPCWDEVTGNLPDFPQIAMPGSGFCWDNCTLAAQECTDVIMNAPLQMRCGQYAVDLNVVECGTGISLLGGRMTLDYTRTWDEIGGVGGATTQVWRFAAKVDVVGDFFSTPLCPVPTCLGPTPTAFFYGYVDYAYDCGADLWSAALVLFHNCDLFVHNQAISATPGTWHPTTTYAVVAPDTPANPFVPSTVVLPGGPLVAEATRNVVPISGSADCVTEDPIVAGNFLPFFVGCMCPLSFVPAKNTIIRHEGTGTCTDSTGMPTSFRSISLASFPTIPWFELVATSIGTWTTTASYPGPETATVQEGLYRYYDSCAPAGSPGGNFIEVFYGASTTEGYPVLPTTSGLTQNFTDLASNFSKAPGVPAVPPFAGVVMPTNHLIYTNNP